MAYTATKTGTFQETGFRIGRVISKTFDVFFQNIITFTVIAGIIWLPFVIFSAVEQAGQVPNAGPPTAAQITQSLVSLAIIMVLSPLATAIILHGAFQSMRGRPVSLGESVSAGLSRFLPLLGAIFLSALGVMLGMVLLVVPGIILLLMWYVAIPACVVERTGPVRSLGRSRELTKGYRWRILAIVLIIGVLSAVGRVLIAAVGGALGSQWAGVALIVLWQGLSGGFGGVLGAVIYYYLRVAKEGVDVDQIAAVFD